MGLKPQESSTPATRPHKALLRCALEKNTRRARLEMLKGAPETRAQSGPFRSSKRRRCACNDARAIEIGQFPSLFRVRNRGQVAPYSPATPPPLNHSFESTAISAVIGIVRQKMRDAQIKHLVRSR